MDRLPFTIRRPYPLPPHFAKFNRDAALALCLVFFFLTIVGGFTNRSRDGGGARSYSVNNLKQIGLAMQNYNDSQGYLPYNGGHTDPKELEDINFGWHNPNVRDSGTWATQISPFIEQAPFFANNLIIATSVNDIPEWFEKASKDGDWQRYIRQYNDPGRGREGFKSDIHDGNYPGPVIDYAINIFINSPPTKFNAGGFALDGGIAIAGSSHTKLEDIADGAANTIFAGGKALPVSLAQSPGTITWDEGIFSPGNYIAAKEKSILHSTGTGRGHLIDANAPTGDVKDRPANGGVPWMYEDSELAGPNPPPYAMDWGGPFKGGVLFLFADGSVRSISYKARGTANFARMLYPNDGGNVAFD